MRISPILISLLLAFCTAQSDAQQSAWTTYAKIEEVLCQAADGNILWVGTPGGVVRLDMSTGERIFYTRTNSGLIDNRINGVAIDSSGVVWFTVGTQVKSALIGFDGTTWEVKESPNILIKSVVVDRDNNKWVTNNIVGMIWKYHGKGKEWYSPAISQNSLGKIAVDHNNDIWAGSAAAGAGRLRNETWTQFDPNNSGIPSTNVMDIFTDRDGMVWFGTSSGLARYDGTDWIVYNTENSNIADNTVRAITQGPDGNIWICSSNHISRFDGTTWTVYIPDFSQGLLGGISSITVDAAGRAWLGTGSGLFRFDGTTTTHVSVSEVPLPSNNITAIAVDRSGVRWIGSDAGVVSYDGTWDAYTTANSALPANTIKDIAIGHDNAVLVATGNGLAKFDGTTWANISVGLGTVDAVAVDRDGNYWISARLGPAVHSIRKYIGNSWTIIEAPNVGDDRGPNVIAVDSSSNIWFARPGKGVMKFNGTTWTEYDQASTGMRLDRVSAIATDRKGRIWFATEGQGLTMFDGSAWINYMPAGSMLPSTALGAIGITPDNGIWAGSGGPNSPDAGVGYRADGESSWVRFNRENSPLPDGNIASIAIDSVGNTWFATRKGIAVYKSDGVASAPPSVRRPHENSADNSAIVRSIPNPFSSQTMIEYTVRGDGMVPVELVMTDIYGNEVAVLVREQQVPGSYSLPFNGAGLPSGSYFCRLRAGAGRGIQRVELSR